MWHRGSNRAHLWLEVTVSNISFTSSYTKWFYSHSIMGSNVKSEKKTILRKGNVCRENIKKDYLLPYKVMKDNCQLISVIK